MAQQAQELGELIQPLEDRCFVHQVVGLRGVRPMGHARHLPLRDEDPLELRPRLLTLRRGEKPLHHGKAEPIEGEDVLLEGGVVHGPVCSWARGQRRKAVRGSRYRAQGRACLVRAVSCEP